MLINGDLQRGETLANTIAYLPKAKKGIYPASICLFAGRETFVQTIQRKRYIFVQHSGIDKLRNGVYNRLKNYTKLAFGIIRTNQYREVYLMANTQPKYKAFSLVTYAEAEQITDILNQKFDEGVIDCYAFSYHDKDLREDGSLKEPHYHIVLQSTSHRTAISVKKWFNATTDFKGELANTCVQCTHKRTVKGNEIVEKVDLHGATCYLVHEDKDGNPLPNKYHYSWDIVISKNIDILKTPVSSGRSSKVDNSYEILQKVIDGVNFYHLAKEYGRDFIIHWTKYRDLCSHIYGHTIEEEEKRRERERIDYELEALAKSCERMNIEEKLRKENEILKAQLVVAGIRFEKEI